LSLVEALSLVLKNNLIRNNLNLAQIACVFRLEE